LARRTARNIKAKGFDMQIKQDYNEEYVPIDYNKIKVGMKTVDNVLTDINYYAKVKTTATKENVLRALSNNDLASLRDFSDFFYKTSGIYARLCRYLAYLYRYDWTITPIVLDNKLKEEKIVEGFYKALTFMDNFNVRKTLGEIALKTVRFGVYYGYIVMQSDRAVIQELPVKYCRSRFFSNGKPVVEFNMKYFDDTFPDTQQRIKIIKSFPSEFQKGYIAYKEGKLQSEYMGDGPGWYLLDTNYALKFTINGEETPILAGIIPSIIDLDEAQELDRRKMQQQLLKILIQQMPLDRNGELIFDVDEARALHNNAVSMLDDILGIDVLTTFAEVKVEDLADRSTTTSVDEIMKVERAVFNEAGISQNQFNTTGNLALEKSIANDEAGMQNLILQFDAFLNNLLAPFNKNPKRLSYRFQLLYTTIYNYKEISKLYKEQMQIGFSKMLPQIALGQSQSSILATAYFENEILDLNSIFTPPAMSSTTVASPKTGDGAPGRPELADEDKSEKTIQNRESMS